VKLDLALAYQERREEYDAAIQRVLSRGSYILGEEVRLFEQEFAAYLGTSHAVGVASGTDALALSLRACGVAAGDQVITTPFTSVATAAAIEACGAKPLWIDVDETYTIDLNRVEECLKRRTGVRAIVPVHLYGYAVDMQALTSLAGQYGLRVIEDCAQAHGAAVDEKKVGTWGQAGAFSFYPTKNLGAFGDGGMVVAQDASLAEKIRLLRQYGWKTRQISEIPGQNSRLDEIQAAVLRVGLRYLDEDNRKRIRLAQIYDEELQGTPLVKPELPGGLRHVYHQYVIRTPARAELREVLERQGIAAAIHYPAPVHLQPAYRGKYESVGGLENSERLSAEVLSLPMFPQMRLEQARWVGGVIKNWFQT
jgi:dTDP-4-amino-4,6-dideoxygalactose transaminase